MKCDPISEDDPNDLAEAWTLLVAYFPANYTGTDQRLELRFPARVTSFHWTQTNGDDKNDSLSANLVYNTNPKVYGYTIQAHAKDFTITVTRYDNTRGGTIEGKFEGIMESYIAWTRQTVLIPVKGNFHTVRNGKGWECRKQRASEKIVVSKAVKVFENTFLPSLQKTGWKIDEELNGYNAVVSNNPSPFRPLSLCSSFFDLKLSVNPNSAYGRMLEDSAEYYSKQTSQNANDTKAMTQAAQNMFRIQNMRAMEIEIDDNSPFIKSEYIIGSKDRFTVLHIPQVAYACQIYRAAQDGISPPEEKTYLCFGNWAGADMHANAYVSYPFVHKQHAPVLENIMVTFTGPSAAVNEIIKNIDWSKMNDALTK